MAEYISSLNNPAVKKAASLFKKSARDKEGLFLIEGDSLVLDAAQKGIETDTVFVFENASLSSEIIGKLEKVSKKLYMASEQVMKKITDLNTPPAVIACAKIPQISYSAIKKGSYILLEDLQDPGNVGAVIRTAAALSIDGVIVCGGCDIFSGKVLRGSMGASLTFPVFRFENSFQAIEKLHSKGNKIYAAVLNNKAKPIGEYSLGKGTVVAIGNEGNGLKKETVEMCDGSLYIPISDIESLNAAVAASICIWEMSKNA